MAEAQKFDANDYIDGGKNPLKDNNYADLKGLTTEQIKQIALARIASRGQETVTISEDKEGALQIVKMLNPFDKNESAPVSAPVSAPAPAVVIAPANVEEQNNEINNPLKISNLTLEDGKSLQLVQDKSKNTYDNYSHIIIDGRKYNIVPKSIKREYIGGSTVSTFQGNGKTFNLYEPSLFTFWKKPILSEEQ